MQVSLGKWIRIATLGALGILGAMNMVRAQGSAPLKINYGAPSADYYVLYVARDAGLFQKHGLEPTFYWFATGAPLLAGLKSDSLDVVTTGLATAFALGQKIPIKVLFWDLDDAAAATLVVSPKSGVTSYKDIAKAKAIGAPSGTCAQVALGLIARKVGIKVTQLNAINIAPPLYANAFASGSIDAGVTWAPYGQALAERGQVIVNYDSDYEGVCPVLTSVRTAFLQKHPEVGHKLVRIHAEAQQLIEKNPQLAIDALVKNLSVTPTVAKATFDRLCCARKPTFAQQIDPASPYSLVSVDGGLNQKLRTATQMLADAGSIPAPLTAAVIAEAVDASYVREFVANQKKAAPAR